MWSTGKILLFIFFPFASTETILLNQWKQISRLSVRKADTNRLQETQMEKILMKCRADCRIYRFAPADEGALVPRITCFPYIVNKTDCSRALSHNWLFLSFWYSYSLLASICQHRGHRSFTKVKIKTILAHGVVIICTTSNTCDVTSVLIWANEGQEDVKLRSFSMREPNVKLPAWRKLQINTAVTHRGFPTQPHCRDTAWSSHQLTERSSSSKSRCCCRNVKLVCGG